MFLGTTCLRDFVEFRLRNKFGCLIEKINSEYFIPIKDDKWPH